jgi:hypothetical protein
MVIDHSLDVRSVETVAGHEIELGPRCLLHCVVTVGGSTYLVAARAFSFSLAAVPLHDGSFPNVNNHPIADRSQRERIKHFLVDASHAAR